MQSNLALESMSDAAWQTLGVYAPPREGEAFSSRGRSQWILELGTGAKLIVDKEDDDSSWLSPMLNSLREVLALPANWDSYGAHPVDLKAVAFAIEFLIQVMRKDTMVPVVVPTVKGGIQLEWHARGIDLEMEVSPQGRCFVSYQSSRDHTEWEGDLNYNLDRLYAAIPQLSRQP